MSQALCRCGFPLIYTPELNFQKGSNSSYRCKLSPPPQYSWLKGLSSWEQKNQKRKGWKILFCHHYCYLKSWSLPLASVTVRSEGNKFSQQMLEDTLQDLELRSPSIRGLQFAWCFVVLFSFLLHLGVKLWFMIKEPNLSPSHTYYETNWALAYLYNVCRSNGLLIQIIHPVWLVTVLQKSFNFHSLATADSQGFVDKLAAR